MSPVFTTSAVVANGEVRPIAPDPPAIVELIGVTRTYGSRAAVEQVDLALLPGKLTFLVGPSGAGKTTLLKLINREIRPTSGEVWVAGIAAHRLKTTRVATLRRRVGVVFQDFKLLPRLTAMENVAFGLQVVDLRVSDQEAQERALDALDAVGLGNRGGAFPNELSGGQQQRVAIARAVVAQPPVLIADEPTGNLDQETALEIMDLFEDIAAWGTAVLVATHNIDIVTRHQRRVVTLVDGRLVRDQPEGQTGRMAWLALS
jgi:cell division transport system ATP-binding protein